jgi:hypothetical protein
MSLADQMADDHRRDYASKAEMDALRTTIHSFLHDPAKAKRCRANTRGVLEEACVLLRHDADHVVAVWD